MPHEKKTRWIFCQEDTLTLGLEFPKDHSVTATADRDAAAVSATLLRCNGGE